MTSKPSPNRVRLAVPPTMTRSSERWSDIASTSVLATIVSSGRSFSGNSSGSAASRSTASAMRSPITARFSRLAEGRDGLLLVVELVGQLEHPLLDAAGREDHHQHDPGGAQHHQLDVAHRRARQRRVLHDRHLPGQLRQQPHRAVDDVVEVDRSFEQGGDGTPLGRAQRLDLAEPVDEQPVALVGGDPPGAGVRLGDEPLLLERRHVVADGRRRDTELVPLDERLRPDGLLGGDVVLHDRAEHGELAVPDHGPPPASPLTLGWLVPRLALINAECQCY